MTLGPIAVDSLPALQIRVLIIRLLGGFRQCRVRHPVEDMPHRMRVVLSRNFQHLLLKTFDVGIYPARLDDTTPGRLARPSRARIRHGRTTASFGHSCRNGGNHVNFDGSPPNYGRACKVPVTARHDPTRKWQLCTRGPKSCFACDQSHIPVNHQSLHHSSREEGDDHARVLSSDRPASPANFGRCECHDGWPHDL